MSSKVSEGSMRVTKTQLNRKTGVESGEIHDEKIEVRVFQTAHATVRVGASQTWSLAPYESLNIRVEMEVPCYVEEMSDVQKELVTKLPVRVKKAYETYCDKMGIEYE